MRETSADEEELVGHYRRIQAHFRQIQTNVSMSTWSIANEHLADTRLKGLGPAKKAAYDSSLSAEINRRGCTEGTRIGVLSGLDDWLNNPASASVYWMNGMAGTGKTTIAWTYCERIERRKLLAATFFCTRGSAECRTAARVIPTIAYQLARYSLPFRLELCEILAENPDIGSKTIQKQFERLLKEPLERAKNAIPENLLVVIDALDECDDRSGVEEILEMLFQYSPDVPLKFLVTSRPEPEIYRKMSLYAKFREVVHLHEIEKSLVRADIELYLGKELKFMSPSPTEIEQLVDRSGTLFIYAATLVRYIRSDKRSANPHKRLRSVLNMTPEATKTHTHIDALYTAVLESALSDDEMEADEAEDIRVVLRTVLSAQEPISIETIATFSGIDDPQRVIYALHPLRSVLHQSEETGLVSTLHASFPDFMFNNERSGAYFCDIVEHSRLLAQRCFLVMKEQLRFNICDLETSFVPDEKVDNIKRRIKEKISPTLTYACRYWTSHLALAPKSDTLLKALDEFLCHRLLFWIEVLSLRREITMGADGVLKVQKWLIHAGPVSLDLAQLTEDAYRFTAGFALNPVSQSTPHVYLSSLAFCPRSSLVYKHYRGRFQQLLELKGNIMGNREGAALATWKVDSGVLSIDCSSDGGRIVVGCEDGAVSILNAYTGTLLVGPLQRGSKPVDSVAFSPDGRWIASTCVDNAIRVWDARNGTLTVDPREGHDRPVLSLAFSPDSARIVSGSGDHSIVIWNTYDDAILKGPLEGHTGVIYSIKFSPTGTLIASASADKTIRLWNSHSGVLTAPPFRGHTGWIVSLAFTPDGTRLISSAQDGTIRVWNVTDGSLVIPPIEGYAGSVAVSPDGSRIASCSKNRTLRVWKLEDGNPIAGPFVDTSAQSGFSQVVYAPDGIRLISGNRDGTVHVWSVRDGMFLPPFLRQDASVGIRGVTFSPDGAHFLSSDKDGVIRVWDASNGTFTTIATEAEIFPSHLSILSLDGSCIASTANNGEVQLMSTLDGSVVAGPFGVKRTSLSTFWFSRMNRAVIMGCDNGEIKVYDMQSGRAEIGSFRGHHSSIGSLAESPDGTLLVSCSGRADDQAIRVWNVFAPALDIRSSTYSSPSPPERSCAAVYDGWSIEKNGWVVNNRGDLLFWVPIDIASAWCSPYATLAITESGILQIPKQKPLIGNWWARCYITE